MKKNIIVFLLLIAIISLSVFEQVYIKKYFSYFESEVDEIIAVYENPDLSYEKMNALVLEWDKKRVLLECSVSHGDLIEIELLFNECKGNILSGDAKTSLSALVRLKDTMRLTAHVLGCKWEHIF